MNLFENIHSGADKTRFVDDATYFTLNKRALQQIHQQKLETMTLQIPFGASKRLEVNLNKANFLADDFKVTVQSEESHNTLSYSPSLFYRGAVSGVKDAMVTINFFKEAMTGVLSLNGENYNLGRYGETETFVLYKERNLNASNPFSCSTEDPKEIIITRNTKAKGRSNNTVKVYVECDYHLFVANGSDAQRTTDFTTGLFNVISAIYANDDINVELSEIKIWSTPDPYPNSSAKTARDAFGVALGGNFNGDIAHLLSNYKLNGTVPNGGSANIDALCDREKAVGYTNITTGYSDYPTYSWTAYAVTHEIGHNLGSPHTHSCLWPTGPIDNCWCPEGDCGVGPEPAASGGTVMSYCHLNPQWTNDCELSAANPGINLANGFGQLPGALIRSRIAAAGCLGHNHGGGVVYAFQASANVRDDACGDGGGGISLTVSYGQSPYQYQWNTGATTKDLTNVSAGNYTCQITDASGQVTEVSATVYTKELFIVNAGEDKIIGCAEPIVVLDGSDSPQSYAYNYMWKNLTGSVYGNVRKNKLSVSESGTYVLTVQNEDTGCSVSDTVIVTEDYTVPTISLTSEPLTCDNPLTTIRLTSSSNELTLEWTGPNGFNSISKTPLVSEAGLYRVVATAPNGCTDEASIEVVGRTEAPVISANGATLTCGQPEAQLMATTNQSVSYKWTGPNNFQANTANPIVSKAGFYTIEATNENGCSSKVTVEVKVENAVPELSIGGGTLTCDNPTLQLSAKSTMAGTYSWTGPNDFQSSALEPTVAQAGIYKLVVTTANGCFAEATTEVKMAADAPQLTVDATEINCKNDLATFSVNTSATDLAYEWIGPNNFSSTEKAPSVQNAGMYQMTATATNGCQTTIDVLVKENFTQPKISVQGENIICNRELAKLQVVTNDEIINYQWSNRQGVIGEASSIEVRKAGLYVVTATTANGCSVSESYRVEALTEMSKLELKADDLNCRNATSQLKVITEMETATFAWQGPNNFLSTDATPTVNLPGNYTVLVKNDNGCSQTGTITVHQAEKAQIFFDEIPNLSCSQEVVTIDASASIISETAVAEWSTSNGNIIHKTNELVVTVDQPGTYALTVRDLETECVTVETVTIKTLSKIAARIADSKVLSCQEPTVNLTAESGSYSENTIFEWTTTDGNIVSEATSREITVDAPGVYTLLIVDTLSGCTDATFTNVLASSRTAARLEEPSMLSCVQPTTTISGLSSELNATSVVEWRWNGTLIPNSNVLNLTVNTSGIYEMTITDTLYGCQSSANVTITKHEAPKVSVAQVEKDFCGKGEGSIELAVETDNLYQIKWNNGATGNKLEGLKAGLYKATVTDNAGCQMVVNQRIDKVEPIALQDIDIQPIQCSGSADGAITVALKGGNGDFEAQWSNGDTGLEVSDLGAGIHTLEVMDKQGCVQTFDFPLSSPNPLNVEVEVVHNDVKLEVGGGSPDYSYLWSNGGEENYGSNFEPGTHEVTVTDRNGCSVTESFDIDATTSADFLQKEELTITTFPNPTTDYFSVRKNVQSNNPIRMAVFSSDGQQIVAAATRGYQKETTFNTENWKAGTYFLQIFSDEGTSTHKIQVIKK
ncbi:MAG: M12 family metallo-peptidase [Bacteroidota bacterium]